MTIKGVLFDFSGTLLRVEPVTSWLRAALAATGISLPEAEVNQLASSLEEVGALPGGSAPRAIPPELESLWRERDLHAGQHRTLYTGLARQVPLPDPALYDALYDRHLEPAAWQPYPDTAEVLRTLWEREIKIAVISNIGWDLRHVMRGHDLDRYVDAYALSFEHTVQKPEPELFRVATDALELAPESLLMVGDDKRTDAGASAIGCAVYFVEHLPTEQRPNGLRPVLELVG